MNLQLFSALREAERRRAIPSMTEQQYYDRHMERDQLTGRDLLWVAALFVLALTCAAPMVTSWVAR